MRWVMQQIGSFLEVLHSPEKAFLNEFSGPSFLVPLCVLGLLGIGISVLQSPIQIEWMRFQLEAAGSTGEQVKSSLDMMNKSSVISLLLTPILVSGIGTFVLLAARCSTTCGTRYAGRSLTTQRH